MGQKDFLITMALIVIFSLALINMTIGLGNDVDAKISLSNSDLVGNLNNTIITNARSGEATFFNNGTGESFERSTIAETSDAGTLVTGSVFKDAPKSNIGTVYTVIRNAQRAIFGEDSAFYGIFTIIITLIGTISVLLIWKTWKGGNPE